MNITPESNPAEIKSRFIAAENRYLACIGRVSWSKECKNYEAMILAEEAMSPGRRDAAMARAYEAQQRYACWDDRDISEVSYFPSID